MRDSTVPAVLTWFRVDLRRRWKSLLVLALLVAFAAGTVMTAVAGARRGASVVDRLLAQTLPADVAVPLNQNGFDWTSVRALPQVDVLSTFGGAAYVVDGVPDDSVASIIGDDEAMRTIERPVVLAGRALDPARPDEAVVTPQFEDTYGKGIGDTVTIRLFTPAAGDRYFLDPTVEPDGPVVEATIVGVVRSPWFSDSIETPGTLIFSPGLHATYPANLGDESEIGYFNAIARLHGGEAAIPAFQAELVRVTGRTDIDVWNLHEMFYRHFDEIAGFEADALLVFAGCALVAAFFLVGQAVARYAASTVADLQVLRSVGLTLGQSRWSAAIGPILAALAGSLLGAGLAVLVSRWFPIGTAALGEPAPGIDVDEPVLAAGILAAPLLVGAGAVLAASFALRATRAGSAARRSTVATAVGRAGLPVPVVVGTRFALEPGRGEHTIPVRPAIVGAVTGVLGVLAAFTFSAGVDDAAGNLARFGQTHQLQAFIGLAGQDFVPAGQVLAEAAADPDVAAVNDAYSAVAEIGGSPLTVYSYGAGVAETTEISAVLTEGAMPATPGQIVLGPTTAAELAASVGDELDVVGTGVTRTLTVSGIGFIPDGSHNDYASGAWTTTDGYAELFTVNGQLGFKFHEGLVELRPGADPSAVVERMAASGVEVAPPEPPEALAEIRQIRGLPMFLAGFLALLAAGAVGHALATAVRRRRHDVAVLRALGMTRRQSRAAVVVQATVLALVGLVLGVPLGVALGRTVWRYVAETTPLFYVAPVAMTALILVVPVVLLAASLLAAWPSHRAASMRVAQVLRAE